MTEPEPGSRPDAESPPTTDAALAWLRTHPDVFVRHPELLEVVEIPHSAGRSVSLVERQLGVLRERNGALRAQLDTLLETGRANDALFTRTRALVLDLIDTPPREIAPRCVRHLREEFGIEEVVLLLHDGSGPERNGVRHATREETGAAIGHLIAGGGVLCGHLREREVAWLFGRTRQPVASAAIASFGTEEAIGVLALGSHDPDRFASGTDTMFVQFIADVLARMLGRNAAHATSTDAVRA